jgi:hypothetical protein
MIGEGALTFREFVMQEPLTLAEIHDAVLEFLRGRGDVVLFGAQAVNAYVGEPRMTQDVDVTAVEAPRLASELRDYLANRFGIAVRVLEVAGGRGFRLYQVRKPANRHLVDIRAAAELPPSQWIGGVLVAEPAELVAEKVIAYQHRQGRPKSGTDWRDLAMLLLTYPELWSSAGPVRQRLEAHGAKPAVLSAWETVVAQEILPESEEDEF